MLSASDDRLEKEFGFISIEDCGFKFPDNMKTKPPGPINELIYRKSASCMFFKRKQDASCMLVKRKKDASCIVDKRKPRSNFCEKQISIMQNFFHTKSTYLEPEDLKIMIEKTGLNGYQIRKWFSNMRSRKNGGY